MNKLRRAQLDGSIVFHHFDSLARWNMGDRLCGCTSFFLSLGDHHLAGLVASKLFSLMGWICIAYASYGLVFLLVTAAP